MWEQKTERGVVKVYASTMAVRLENGKVVNCYGNTPEQAIENAWIEFGIRAVSAGHIEPKILEYSTDGLNLYAHYDDGSESFVLRAESEQHAERKMRELSSKI